MPIFTFSAPIVAVSPNTKSSTKISAKNEEFLSLAPPADSNLSTSPKLTFNKPQNFAKVTFTNRGLAKALPNVRGISSKTPDRKSLVEIATALKDVKIQRSPPLGIPSIPEFVGIDYIGYIIEKERLDKKTGEWHRIDEFRIVGSQANNFKDSRVAYGNCYRYRIKSVAKVTKAIEKESLDKFDIMEDVRRLEADRIKEVLAAKQEVIASVDRITNVGLRPKISKGAHSTVFDIVEGLKISATEQRTDVVRVVATSSIDRMRSLRQSKNLRLKNEDIMRGTISREKLQKEVNKNIATFIEKKVEYMSYYYESDPSAKWIYVDVSESIPPPPPSAIKVTPNTPKECICITWLTPANNQRDIKGFKLYKRASVGRAWFAVGEFALHENIYEDYQVGFDRERSFAQEYVYALTCIDVHGIESVLSTQIQAELNPNYNTEKEERPLKWVSGAGAIPDEDFDHIFKKFYEPEEPIIAEDNIVIGPTRVFKDTQKKLLIKITSLDMHESKEIVLTLKNENIRNDREG